MLQVLPDTHKMIKFWTKIKTESGLFIRAFGIISFTMLFVLLPLKYASNFGGAIGRFMFKLRRGHHPIINKNFTITLAPMSRQGRTNLQLKIFENYGRNLAELLHLPKFSKQKERHRIKIKGATLVQKALAQYGAVIFASGHFSNLHIAAVVSERLAPRLDVIYQRHRNHYIGTVLELVYRRTVASRFLSREQNPIHEGAKSLGDKRSVLLFCDQRAQSEDRIRFFGREVNLPLGSALLSLRCGVPIIPFCMHRVSHGDDRAHFVAEYSAPIVPPSVMPVGKVARRAVMREMMEQVFARFEVFIRTHPTEWLWTYDLWREFSDVSDVREL